MMRPKAVRVRSQPIPMRDGHAGGDHEEVVDGHGGAENPRLAVAQIEPARRDGRRSPRHADQVFQHEHQREGQEELERLVAVVDEAEEAALDDHAHEAHREPAQRQGDDEERRRPAVRGEVRDGRHAGVRAQGVERPAGQVEDLLHAEDHLQSRGHEEEDGGVEHTAHQDVHEVRGHSRGVYSMTRSARLRSDGGSVRPRALAVFRLITSSNLVGCSTGRSPGLAPLKIRSM